MLFLAYWCGRAGLGTFYCLFFCLFHGADNSQSRVLERKQGSPDRSHMVIAMRSIGTWWHVLKLFYGSRMLEEVLGSLGG